MNLESCLFICFIQFSFSWRSFSMFICGNFWSLVWKIFSQISVLNFDCFNSNALNIYTVISFSTIPFSCPGISLWSLRLGMKGTEDVIVFRLCSCLGETAMQSVCLESFLTRLCLRGSPARWACKVYRILYILYRESIIESISMLVWYTMKIFLLIRTLSNFLFSPISIFYNSHRNHFLLFL